MRFHPLAEVLPLIEGAEFTELVASIKASGLREPITRFEDMILDGRNRFRGCLAAGVEPQFCDYTGDDPIAFVTDRNLRRRQLTPAQKAMAVEKYATLSSGQQRRNHAGVMAPAPKTRAEIAALAGVHMSTISCAHTIRKYGTPEEIAAVENGTAAIARTAQTIRERERPKRTARTGPVLGLPKGRQSLIDVVCQGIELERHGVRVDEIGARIGMGKRSYIVVRDILLLSRRDDLAKHETVIVSRALHEVVEKQQVVQARRKIAPIVKRIWGQRMPRIGGKLRRSNEAGYRRFNNAIEFLVHTCDTATAVTIPFLTDKQAAAAIKQLNDAEASLRTLKGHIKGGVVNG